jgi:hypothetical protein
MQLRFASFAVINLRRDLHPQECARAGRTKKAPAEAGARKPHRCLGAEAPAQGGKAGNDNLAAIIRQRI